MALGGVARLRCGGYRKSNGLGCEILVSMSHVCLLFFSARPACNGSMVHQL